MHENALNNAESLVQSILRHDYDSAYNYTKKIQETLLKLLEDEMYKGSNND